MNITTWIVETNWAVWVLLIIETVSLMAIAIRLWTQRKFILVNDKSKSLSSIKQILSELKTTKWLIWGILLTLIFIYCFWMCIHYHIHHYVHSNITSKPVDYFGIIVGFFSLLVTLLVGWNIYSTIKAREELKDIKDNLDKEFRERVKSLDEKIFKLSLRNNSAISTLSIGTYFEILNFTIMANNGDFKINDNEQLRLRHLHRDVLNILRGLDASNEIADCNTSDFKFYAKVSKEVKEPWLITYVRKFFVFGNDNQKISSEQTDELFDKA